MPAHTTRMFFERREKRYAQSFTKYTAIPLANARSSNSYDNKNEVPSALGDCTARSSPTTVLWNTSSVMPAASNAQASTSDKAPPPRCPLCRTWTFTNNLGDVTTRQGHFARSYGFLVTLTLHDGTPLRIFRLTFSKEDLAYLAEIGA